MRFEDFLMISIISGLVVTGAGAGGLVYFMPRGGRVHPLATAPLLDSIIPIGIVSALAIGIALIVSGVAGI
jgi:hypothetical protein